jgi:transposase
VEYATYFLNQTQYDWLAAKLPEPVTKTKHVIPNNELLNGILLVLKTDCRWQDIPGSVCAHDPSSCWRRLNFWIKRGALKLVWRQVLVLLDKQGELDLSLATLTVHLSSHHSFGMVPATPRSISELAQTSHC